MREIDNERAVRREGRGKRDGGESDGMGSSATGKGQRSPYKGEVGGGMVHVFSPLDTSRPLGLLVRISFNSKKKERYLHFLIFV
jgi:hypothetical protein